MYLQSIIHAIVFGPGWGLNISYTSYIILKTTKGTSDKII